MSTPVADQPRRDGPEDGRGPSSPDGPRRSRRARSGTDPALTVEALLARSRAAAAEAAARLETGEGPGEGRGAADAPAEGRAGRRRRAERTGAPPAAAAVPPASGAPGTTELPALQVVRPAVTPPPRPPLADGVRPSAPVPPLPGADGVRHSAPLPSLPGTDGARYSTPVPPLPGRPRTAAPLPPIPGRDAPAPEPAPPTRAEKRAAMSPLRRRLGRVAVVLAVLVSLVGGYYVGLYFYVDRSISRVAALSPDAPEVLAPQLQEGDQTYLVVGTGLPGATGAASVTTLVAHVSADGDRAVLVTVPSTALVDTPQCRDADGGLREPHTGSFADALLDGGPSCLVRSVQQLSGLRVDHYLAVDLSRLPGMVDALGGVPVCLATPLDPGSAGSVAAGSSELSGDQAAALLASGSTGSDVTGVEIAEREQLVLTSTLRAALSLGNLADPITATTFLTRAADAFTVDDDTSLGDVRALAATLADLPADAVQRTSVPVSRVGYVPSGSSTAHVLLDGEATRRVFDSVIQDGVLPSTDPTVDPATAAQADSAAAPGAEDAGTPAQPATVTVAPADVTVDVLDATGGGDGGGAEGAGATVAAALTAQGFRTGTVGVEPGLVGQTVVRFGPASVEQARTVAAAVPGAVLQPSDAVGESVQLVVATADQQVQPVAVGAAVPESAAPAAAPASAVASCG